MKKLIYASMIVASAFAIQGCGSENKDSQETADSLNEVKDTTSNAAATGGIAVVEADAEFATKAAVNGLAEVEFSKLALTKTSDAKIKAFADMMVNDHGKVNEELKALAATKNITLPAVLDEDHTKIQNDLNGLSGKDFDKKYVDVMVDGHQKTLDLLEKQAKDSKDADLMAFASKTAPTVKSHLEAIKKIKDQIK